MSIDGRTYHSAGYSEVIPGHEDRPSYLCPDRYIPNDGLALRMSRARFVEVDRADFERDGDVLVDREGGRWEQVRFVPSGAAAEGVSAFFVEGALARALASSWLAGDRGDRHPACAGHREEGGMTRREIIAIAERRRRERRALEVDQALQKLGIRPKARRTATQRASKELAAQRVVRNLGYVIGVR